MKLLFEMTVIINGAHLASATVPWHWLFFCPAPKFVGIFRMPGNKKNLKAPKWHWLILDPMGALENVGRSIHSTIYFQKRALCVSTILCAKRCFGLHACMAWPQFYYLLLLFRRNFTVASEMKLYSNSTIILSNS